MVTQVTVGLHVFEIEQSSSVCLGECATVIDDFVVNNLCIFNLFNNFTYFLPLNFYILLLALQFFTQVYQEIITLVSGL